MKAEFKPSYDPNRQSLPELLPLAAPWTIYIEPTKACNFKCFYCMHGTRGIAGGAFEGTGYQCGNMEWLFYTKLVREIMDFPARPKRIVFSGLGEPLCNPRLPQMIALLRQAGFEGRIDIITNGSLLTPDRSDAIIKAGVSKIQISLQGLDSVGYQKNCGVPLPMENFLENLAYLYNNKGSAEIFIKIIDALLETEAQKAKFFHMFGDLCDTIFVEHLIVLQTQMGNHGGKVDPTKNFNNEEMIHRKVCPVIVYHLQVSVEGHTFPCPVSGLPRSFSMGNAKEQSLAEIWNGRKRTALIRAQLMGKRGKMEVCKECSACAAVLDERENLDSCAADLLAKFPLYE